MLKRMMSNCLLKIIRIVCFMENFHNQKVLIEEIPSHIASVLLSAGSTCAGLIMCAVLI